MAKNISMMQSRITNEVLRRAKSVSNTQQHIIIIGEYGSGKSWLAKKIHDASNRSTQPFVNINCYTMDKKEAQKKIFGYLRFTERGINIKRGIFEKGNGGTLFLEGFDTFSEGFQQKVINSVENRNIQHIGSSKKIPIDIRIILSIDVKSYFNVQHKFDLLTNSLDIDPFTINYPPLRERREEIGEMVQTFLKGDLSRRYDFSTTKITPKTMYKCIRYNWPGNVQQLKNAIEHASIVCNGNKIQPEHLPNSVKQGQPKPEELNYLEKTYTYKIAEKNLIQKVLEEQDSHKDAIKRLGLSTNIFEEKINNYQLEPELT